MKHRLSFILALAIAGAWSSTVAQHSHPPGSSESRLTLVLKPDGSCVLSNETVQPRMMLESRVTSWERASRMDGQVFRGTEIFQTVPPKGESKTLSDEELIAKLREMHEDQQPGFSEQNRLQLEPVPGSTNTIRLLTIRNFQSLESLLSEPLHTWGPNVLVLGTARLEMDTNQNLRLTLLPERDMTPYVKNLSKQWKSSRTKFEWKLVLPGRILGSSLPLARENTTALVLDGENPGSIAAVAKLFGAPVVITAEPAGLNIPKPLESKKLLEALTRAGELDLPITDAGPGFIAEPASIAVSTAHHFPEGDRFRTNQSRPFFMRSDTVGTVINTRLFAPRGRQIKNVSQIKVVQATDDQGRSIPVSLPGPEEEDGESGIRHYYSRGSESSISATFDLRMPLPPPDAQAIEELQAEVVALTLGDWKELVLTNIQADPQREIDLGGLIPGATLIIRKIANASLPQKSVQVMLRGPAAINHLDLKMKSGSRRSGGSHMSEAQRSGSPEKLTRVVTVQSYDYEIVPGAKPAPVTLVLRLPLDIKRERVRFKLTALDLL